jgi:hypothetical protein
MFDPPEPVDDYEGYKTWLGGTTMQRDEIAKAARLAYRDGLELCPFDKADPLVQKTWLHVADRIIALLDKQVQDAGWKRKCSHFDGKGPCPEKCPKEYGGPGECWSDKPATHEEVIAGKAVRK